jgi:hypothetical protein
VLYKLLKSNSVKRTKSDAEKAWLSDGHSGSLNCPCIPLDKYLLRFYTFVDDITLVKMLCIRLALLIEKIMGAVI